MFQGSFTWARQLYSILYDLNWSTLGRFKQSFHARLMKCRPLSSRQTPAGDLVGHSLPERSSHLSALVSLTIYLTGFSCQLRCEMKLVPYWEQMADQTLKDSNCDSRTTVIATHRRIHPRHRCDGNRSAQVPASNTGVAGVDYGPLWFIFLWNGTGSDVVAPGFVLGSSTRPRWWRGR